MTPSQTNVLARIFAPRRFTGWHMAGIMIAFFATIIAVNLTMAWFATASWSGLVVKNSYVASQNFDATTAGKRREAALGWHGTISHDSQSFSLHLADATGNPVAATSVTATIGRPATDAQDFTVDLAATGNGTYSAAAALAPGIWQAQVAVTGANGAGWTNIYRFTSPQ